MNQIPENSKLIDVIKALNEVIQNQSDQRDRGPKSTREMTKTDAERIKSGEFGTLKTKQIAEKLGLSYGQVYSCQKGFTFTKV